MTRRRSERELERDVEGLEGTEDAELSDLLWADLKAYYDAPLTPSERRLLAAPQAHLPPADVDRLADSWWSR